MEVTDNVNATGSGHKRTVDQVKLRWKNLKQQATKDHSQAKNPQTGLMTHCKSHLERENASAPDRQPEQRDDAYETLLSRDTERAEG
ncbi:hypothetical protein NQZ68_021815 [Dissostichus eleginoides]|nr:hypothetical protein NQZ68_021815 [Dissostichus eleginoides]